MTSELEQVVGVPFNDERLLQSAFIHRSYKHEHPQRCVGLDANERLEFLGDAVLNFLTAALLYKHFPDRSEGDLTHFRAALVKTSTLAGFARSLDFGAQIKISRGEDTPLSRNRPALLADVFEAVIGAIYLDQGLDGVRGFVLPFLERQIAAIEAGEVEIDYRTRLQEHAQSHHGFTPSYRTVEVRGPDHQREFTLEVLVGDEVLGVGSGPSKQAAAQAAARMALQKLSGA
ncbi:MAG: ribonuclease III [Oscillochloris sp.]|nr:ribonuclease III [Oscillochloris sp.]